VLRRVQVTDDIVEQFRCRTHSVSNTFLHIIEILSKYNFFFPCSKGTRSEPKGVERSRREPSGAIFLFSIYSDIRATWMWRLLAHPSVEHLGAKSNFSPDEIPSSSAAPSAAPSAFVTGKGRSVADRSRPEQPGADRSGDSLLCSIPPENIGAIFR